MITGYIFICWLSADILPSPPHPVPTWAASSTWAEASCACTCVSEQRLRVCARVSPSRGFMCMHVVRASQSFFFFLLFRLDHSYWAISSLLTFPCPPYPVTESIQWVFKSQLLYFSFLKFLFGSSLYPLCLYGNFVSFVSRWFVIVCSSTFVTLKPLLDNPSTGVRLIIGVF